MEILRCENITKTYMNGAEETKVLNDVAFSVEAGEFVSIVGPSGSGKSTLLHIIGGVDRPNGGKVIINGKDIHSFGENRLAIVLADEPTENLDRANSAEIMKLLRRANDESIALQADRMLCIEDGRIVHDERIRSIGGNQ